MLKFAKKNQKQRTNLFRFEQDLLLQKIFKINYLYKHCTSKTIIRKYLSNILKNNTSINSFSKIRSVCMLTGRSRAIYRGFKLSRFKIREYANAGFFTGMSKASW